MEQVCLDDAFRLEAAKVLIQFGVASNYKGCKYIQTAIVCIHHDAGYPISVTKSVYPSLAKTYHVTPESVERAIRHTITIIWNRASQEALEKVFGARAKFEKRPSNAEFLALLYHAVKNAVNDRFIEVGEIDCI